MRFEKGRVVGTPNNIASKPGPGPAPVTTADAETPIARHSDRVMNGSWSVDLLLGCIHAKDAGALCCLNHCCCGICIWSDAMHISKVPHGRMYGRVAIGGAFVGALGATNNMRSLEVLGQAQEQVSYVSGRTALMDHYSIYESSFDTIVARCCCPFCAQVQEVDTVLVREGYHYGYCELVPDDGIRRVIYTQPRQQSSMRPVSVSEPMDRE